jgi:hypothetical protein
MKIIGTHDEITYIMLQCQKRTDTFCKGCVLNTFCEPGMFMRLNPSKLEAIETGKSIPILIAKGDDDSGNEIQ